MRCPKCGKAHTRVVDSRMQESNNTIKRRRECCSCNYRFTTFERCEDPIEVIKSDGSKQRFDRNKLLVGLMRATIKRDIDTKKLNETLPLTLSVSTQPSSFPNTPIPRMPVLTSEPTRIAPSSPLSVAWSPLAWPLRCPTATPASSSPAAAWPLSKACP